MNLDENTKWIIEKSVVIGVAVIGAIGSGKVFSHKKEAGEPSDWPQIVSEQKAVILDLKEHLNELEDANRRKDRFILQLLHDCQGLQDSINELERELNRPPTQWEIHLQDDKKAM